MSAAITLTVLAGLILLVWSSRHIMINREHKKGLVLRADSPGPPETPPMISVVIAAKDEQDNIETCLRTVLKQDYPNFEVILADDRSDDATGEIGDRIAAEDERLSVVHVTDLPAGWCGKCNAMQQAIATARGRWICMMDADCRQTSDRTLSVAMQYARDIGADLLSVLPTLEMKGFWENAIQPVCSGIMMIWFQPDKVNNPDKSNAYANGAFMLISREAYRKIGTHEAVKDKLNEDMHMAARVKGSGLKLRVIRSGGLYLVRMYTSPGRIIRGWSRIFLGTFGTLKRLIISFVVLAVMGFVPYVAAAMGLAMAAANPDSSSATAWWVCGVVGVAAAIMQITVISRFFALAGSRRHLGVTYPLGCAVAMICLIISLAKLRKGAKVVWKSTGYATGG